CRRARHSGLWSSISSTRINRSPASCGPCPERQPGSRLPLGEEGESRGSEGGTVIFHIPRTLVSLRKQRAVGRPTTLIMLAGLVLKDHESWRIVGEPGA